MSINGRRINLTATPYRIEPVMQISVGYLSEVTASYLKELYHVYFSMSDVIDDTMPHLVTPLLAYDEIDSLVMGEVCPVFKKYVMLTKVMANEIPIIKDEIGQLNYMMKKKKCSYLFLMPIL